MKLKVAELKRFFANCGTIKSKGVLPVLEYVKVDKDKIIKTNLTAYVVMDITPVNETLLIDERMLSAIVKVTSSDVIEVTVKDKKVFLSDGVNKMFFTLSAAEHYPEFPHNEKENEVVLTEDVLKSISVASKNIGTMGDAFDYILLAHGYIFASDHFKFYFKKFEGLPTVSLDALAASIISQFGQVTFFERGNYNFFSVGSFLFGFAKQEVAVPDFPTFLNFISKEEFMEFDVIDINNFIELLSASTQSVTTTVDFDGGKLSFYDVDIEVGNERMIDVVGDFKLTASFLPRIISQFLKSLGKERIRMSPMLNGKKGVTVWSEDDVDFTGLLGETTKS